MSDLPSNETGAPDKGAPTLQEKILSLYSEGASDVEVAAALGLSERRFAQMYEELPAFAKIVDLGRTKEKAWWYHVGRRNLTSKTFQGTTWNMNMKNRFKWADKVDVGDKSNEGPDDVRELEKELRDTVERLKDKAPHLVRSVMEGSND